MWFSHVDLDEKWCYAWVPNGKLKLPLGTPIPTKKLNSKSQIPKVIFLTAIAGPRPEYNFNGFIGMWWVSETKVALKASQNHQKGKKYEVDCTMDAAWYLEKLTLEVYPAIRQAMWWLA